MYLNREAITLEEAQKSLLDLQFTTKMIQKKVDKCLGQVLAETITAPFALPAFRKAMYDGYGIRAEDDTDFPKKLSLISNVAAGDDFQGELKKGEVVRIMTGAAVPDGVSKVIMLELTEKIDEQTVQINQTGENQNIIPIGDEFEQGATLLHKGMRLNAGALSLLHAFGIEECQVYAKVKVAILTTGSELLRIGEAPEAGKIYNSNNILLASLIEQNGGEVIFNDHIADDYTLLEQTLNELAHKSDLILTSGGVSVGDFDFLAVAAKQKESIFLFNKLKMRPGSPTTAFVFKNTPILALSGNPGACFTGFFLLAEPFMQKMQGGISRVKQVQLKLMESYQKTNAFDKYLRGAYQINVGEAQVALIGSDQSNALGNLQLTHCLFKVPHNQVVTAGELVEAYVLPND